MNLPENSSIQPSRTNCGYKATVRFTDDSREPQEILIDQLRLSEMPKLLEIQADEVSFAEVVCHQEKGWGDTLLPSHLEEVIILARELNDDPFDRWLDRMKKVTNRMANATTGFPVAPSKAPFAE